MSINWNFLKDFQMCLFKTVRDHYKKKGEGATKMGITHKQNNNKVSRYIKPQFCNSKTKY